jgi:CheY-like chemotaxis protein
MIRAISIDDDIETQLTLGKIARKNGMDIVLFDNLKQAICYLDENEVDLIFIDFMRPLMEGIDFISYLRIHHPAIIIFIMISVMSDKAVMEELFHFHQVGLLTKPLVVDESIARISRFLEGGAD